MTTEPRPTGFVSPTPWRVPDAFGAAAAVQSVGGVAAPLLAGFSITLTGIVLQTPEKFDHPDLVVLFLVGAFLAMVNSVQFALWARQYEVSPSDYESWFPGFIEKTEVADNLYREQRSFHAKSRFWSQLTRGAYNLGILLMLSALLSLLLPHHLVLRSARGAAVCLVAASLVCEYAWLVGNLVRAHSASQARWLAPLNWCNGALWIVSTGPISAALWYVSGTIFGSSTYGAECFRMSRVSLLAFRTSPEPDLTPSSAGRATKCLWVPFGGMWIAASCFFTGAVMCASLVGIPSGVRALRLGAFSLWPFRPRGAE